MTTNNKKIVDKKSGKTIYLTEETFKLFDELDVQYGPFPARFNTDKILALVLFYKENKDIINKLNKK